MGQSRGILALPTALYTVFWMGLPAFQSLLCHQLEGLTALMSSAEHLWSLQVTYTREKGRITHSEFRFNVCTINKASGVHGGDKVLCDLPAIHVQWF